MWRPLDLHMQVNEPPEKEHGISMDFPVLSYQPRS